VLGKVMEQMVPEVTLRYMEDREVI